MESSEDTQIILVENLTKKYGRGGETGLALRGLTFAVNRGEFVAITGPSGSGKTTLLNIIGALDRPSSGKVFVDGVDISRLRSKELAQIRSKRIGFVFQDFNLISRMRVVENVELPLLIAGEDSKPSRNLAMSILSKLGIAEKAGKNVNDISGGEKQRVAVARALANDPSILLADEPTGNLDSENAQVLMSLLSHLNATFQKTLVIVTHNPKVASLAHRVISLTDGSIVGVRTEGK